MSIEKPEVALEKITLKKGEWVHFTGGALEQGNEQDDTYVLAEEDEFAAGKDGPELEAAGGECAVIVIYQTKTKLGAVVHIGVADQQSDRHVELMEEMMKRLPGIKLNRADVGLFLDVEKFDATLRPGRERWKRRIELSLTARGAKSVASYTKGDGKTVVLETQTGKLKVFDDDDNLIFEK